MEKIPDIIHSSWHPYLQPLFDDRKMILIKTQLLTKCRYYPSSENIFRVFSMPLVLVKVVILGQDPYFNGTANGYAFAVNKGTVFPKSLEVLRQEIINTKVERDTDVHIDTKEWGELKHWRQQGVFLLNTALTVEIGNGGSHTGQWQWFTREVIKVISTQVKPVWLLWGAKAKSFKDYIYQPKFLATKDNVAGGYMTNIILEADHPASGSYKDSKYSFEGCNHFNLCNQALKSQGKTIINW